MGSCWPGRPLKVLQLLVCLEQNCRPAQTGLLAAVLQARISWLRTLIRVHADAGGEEGEGGDLPDRLPHASGDAAGNAPDDVLAAVSALRRRDAALAASVALSGADPVPNPGPHPVRAPAADGAAPGRTMPALAHGDRAAFAADLEPGEDSSDVEAGTGAREGVGGAAPGIVSFVGAREPPAHRKRRRRDPPPPEQPLAKKKADSKAQGGKTFHVLMYRDWHGSLRRMRMTRCASLAAQ